MLVGMGMVDRLIKKTLIRTLRVVKSVRYRKGEEITGTVTLRKCT